MSEIAPTGFRHMAPAPPSSLVRAPVVILRWVLAALLALVVFVSCAWVVLAIWYSNLPAPWMRAGAAAAFALAAVLLFATLRRRTAVLVYACAFVGVLVWWLFIPASNERAWAIDNARMPRARIEGDTVVFEGVRAFDWKSEADPVVRYEDRTFDASKVQSIDMLLSYWDGNRAIAHMILSFGFEDGRWLAVSIETRKEKGEGDSTVAGFFKQYELIFVVADERDLVKLRTNLRGEDVYLYPLKYDAAQRRDLFLCVANRVAKLADDPEWYNALEHNCTTAWMGLVQRFSDAPRMFDWRIVANGWIDELAYERGRLVADETDGLPYEEMRQKHAISAIAREVGDGDDFSKAVRARLPQRR